MDGSGSILPQISSKPLADEYLVVQHVYRVSTMIIRKVQQFCIFMCIIHVNGGLRVVTLSFLRRPTWINE